jgi:uncharacterized tellurite resistance protein B-like protein
MPNPLNSILNLIAATILADKRVYASEVEAFITETSKLALVKQLEPNISEAKLLAWYEMNKDAVEANLKGPYFKNWLYSLLDQISKLNGKDQILEVMNKIARADDNVHVSERALIRLAERYWDKAA